MNEDLHLDSQAGALPMRLLESAPRRRSLRKRCGIALLMAALSAVVAIAATAGGPANAFALPVPFPEAPLTEALPPSVPQLSRLVAPDSPSSSPSCGLHYAALLDLAELARHYGEGSGAYRHAFGRVANQLDACRSDERYAAASPASPDSPRAGVPRAGTPVDSYD